jgi:hypothetical protein
VVDFRRCAQNGRAVVFVVVMYQIMIRRFSTFPTLDLIMLLIGKDEMVDPDIRLLPCRQGPPLVGMAVVSRLKYLASTYCCSHQAVITFDQLETANGFETAGNC